MKNIFAAPKTVASAVKAFEKVLADLHTVLEAQEAERIRQSEISASALTLANEADAEAKKAATVIVKLNNLLGIE